MTSTFGEDMCSCVIASRRLLLRVSNMSDKVLRTITAYILCSKTFSENLAVDEIIWKNRVEPERPQMTT